MIVLYLIATLGLAAITHGQPMPQSQANAPSVVPGVFIPADAFKNLQDRANGNANQGYQPNTNVQNPQPTSNQVYQPNSNVPNSQPITNQAYQSNAVLNPQPPQSYQPNTVNSNQPQYQYPQPSNNQPVMTVQPSNNQPTMTVQQSNNQPVMTFQPANNQPAITNQGQPAIGARIGVTNSYQPNVLTNQPNSQPGQQLIYVQQQLPNGQTVLVPQTPTNQKAQPNQGFVVQNGQPTMIITNPNGNGGNQNQGPNPNTVYTLIPLNGQNSNTNSGPYLIPIQPADSNPIMVNAGH